MVFLACSLLRLLVAAVRLIRFWSSAKRGASNLHNKILRLPETNKWQTKNEKKIPVAKITWREGYVAIHYETWINLCKFKTKQDEKKKKIFNWILNDVILLDLKKIIFILSSRFGKSSTFQSNRVLIESTLEITLGICLHNWSLDIPGRPRVSPPSMTTWLTSNY